MHGSGIHFIADDSRVRFGNALASAFFISASISISQTDVMDGAKEILPKNDTQY